MLEGASPGDSLVTALGYIRDAGIFGRFLMGRMFSEPNPFELLKDRVDCVFCI
jgi:hypothetical protein